MRTIAATAFMIVACVVLGACTDDDSKPIASREGGFFATTPPPTQANHPAGPGTPSGAELTFVSSSCQAKDPVVLDQERQSLTANARVRNVGDLKGVWRVTAKWFPAGRDPVKATQTLVLDVGRADQMFFVEPVDQHTFDSMVARQRGEVACRISARHLQ